MNESNISATLEGRPWRVPKSWAKPAMPMVSRLRQNYKYLNRCRGTRSHETLFILIVFNINFTIGFRLAYAVAYQLCTSIIASPDGIASRLASQATFNYDKMHEKHCHGLFTLSIDLVSRIEKDGRQGPDCLVTESRGQGLPLPWSQ